MIPTLIIAVHLVLLLVVAIAVGFVKFEEPCYMVDIAPIQLFKIDNTYSIHFRNIGGFTFQTPFAIVLVTADGDTATRMYGWWRDSMIVD